MALKLLARNTSWFTLCGFKAALVHVTTLPPELKIRSEGVLVAGMHKYFFASRLSLGNARSLSFHHSSGLDSESASGDIKYLSNSLSTFSFSVRCCEASGAGFCFLKKLPNDFRCFFPGEVCSPAATAPVGSAPVTEGERQTYRDRGVHK